MRRLLIVMLGVALHPSWATAQTISDRIRDAKQRPGTPVVVGTLGEPWVLSLEELIRASDLIVVAKVSWLRSYINQADTAVITDSAILPIRVLAGTVRTGAAVPGQTTPLVVSDYGGEAVRDGVTVRAENHNREHLRDGGTYLLFLKKFGKEPGVYSIYNDAAFELSGDTLRPLARQASELFKDFVGRPYSEITPRIAATAKAK